MPAGVMIWAVAAPLAAFMVYRRVRRNFGRQPLRSGRLAVRSMFLVIVAGLLLMAGFAGGGSSMAGWGVLAGLAAGGILGMAGLRMTQFETVQGGHWYTPHPGIGLALTALMLVGWSLGAGLVQAWVLRRGLLERQRVLLVARRRLPAPL